MPPWFRGVLFLLVLVIIAGVFLLVYVAFRMDIFRVTFDFSLVVNIEEEENFKVCFGLS
jgi:hypothetical protein